MERECRLPGGLPEFARSRLRCGGQTRVPPRPAGRRRRSAADRAPGPAGAPLSPPPCRPGSGGDGSGGRARGGAGEGPRLLRLRRRQVWTGRRYGVVRSCLPLPGVPGGLSTGASACAQVRGPPVTLRFRAQRLEGERRAPGTPGPVRRGEPRRVPFWSWEVAATEGAQWDAAPAGTIGAGGPLLPPTRAAGKRGERRTRCAGSRAGARSSRSWGGGLGLGTGRTAGVVGPRTAGPGCCGRPGASRIAAALALGEAASCSCLSRWWLSSKGHRYVSPKPRLRDREGSEPFAPPGAHLPLDSVCL